MNAVVLVLLLLVAGSSIHDSHAFSSSVIGLRLLYQPRSSPSSTTTCCGLVNKAPKANLVHDITGDTSFHDLSNDLNTAASSELSEYYRRDPRDGTTTATTSPIIDQQGLRQALADRYKARRERRYEAVRELDELLQLRYKVKVYDNPNFWTTQRTPPSSHMRKRVRKQRQDMKDMYGPTGHPYRRVGGTVDSVVCTIDITTIHSLLSRRTRCQMDGNHVEADAIKLELGLHGVRLNDDLQQWRADGGDSFETSWTESLPTMSHVSLYEKNEASQEFADESLLERVHRLVEMRANAMAREEDLLVSFISLELYKTYNVGVDDVSKTWSLGCEFAGERHSWVKPEFPKTPLPPAATAATTTAAATSDFSFFRYLPVVFDTEQEHASPPYQPSAFSRPVPCDRTLRRITTLVQERIHKREEHHFAEADAIRRELWATYYVGVNDRLRQWSVGGVFE